MNEIAYHNIIDFIDRARDIALFLKYEDITVNIQSWHPIQFVLFCDLRTMLQKPKVWVVAMRQAVGQDVKVGERVKDHIEGTNLRVTSLGTSMEEKTLTKRTTGSKITNAFPDSVLE